MKASNDQNAPSETPQGSTLIDCLICGYDLGDGSVARCPECGREALAGDADARNARQKAVQKPGVLGALAASCALPLAVAVLLVAIRPQLGARLSIGFAGSMATSAILAVVGAYYVPLTARRVTVCVWLRSLPWLATTIPLTLMTLYAAFGICFIAVQFSASSTFPAFAPLFAMAVPALVFVAWARHYRSHLRRCGLNRGGAGNLLLLIAGAATGLIMPVAFLAWVTVGAWHFAQMGWTF